jgi:phthalate 4,5-dioxygenase oxygenase subunit
MPNKVANVGSEGRVGEGYSVHWHVPVDDENHIRFDFIFNRVRPVAREAYAQEFGTEVIENRYRRNKWNRYLQDRELMKTANFSGMGDHHGAQDAFATESPGPIHDRSREHLGTSDVCIVAARRQLLAGVAAVQAGRDPIHVIRDPEQNDMSEIVVVSEVVAPNVDYRNFWRGRVQKPQAAE